MPTIGEPRHTLIGVVAGVPPHSFPKVALSPKSKLGTHS